MGAPAITVYSMDHVTAALTAADELGVPLCLLSAPGAAAAVGSSVFQAMIDAARQQFPDTSFTAALDCGQDAGHALAAIRQGLTAIILSEECPAYDRVCDIAEQNNVTVLPAHTSSPSHNAPHLDLMDQAEPLAACRDFLHTSTNTASSGTP